VKSRLSSRITRPSSEAALRSAGKLTAKDGVAAGRTTAGEAPSDGAPGTADSLCAPVMLVPTAHVARSAAVFIHHRLAASFMTRLMRLGSALEVIVALQLKPAKLTVGCGDFSGKPAASL
jgi:hypothetical protein